MYEEEFYNLLGYVKVSKTRTKILKSLENDLKMPTEIAKENDFRITLVSNALYDLKQKNLVVCTNEEMFKGRLYKITDDGKKIIECIK